MSETGAAGFNFLRHYGRARGTEKVVTLPSGERVRRWRDDSRTVIQTEHDESLDALVKPKAVPLGLVIPRPVLHLAATARPRAVVMPMSVPRAGGKNREQS